MSTTTSGHLAPLSDVAEVWRLAWPMVAIGFAFLVIVLIGAAMMFFKNRNAKKAERAKGPVEKREEPKKENDNTFFGVPLE